MGVFLSSASRLGHGLVARARYLPHAWTDDPERGQQAGSLAAQPGVTTPQLAGQMVARAFAAGRPATWVTGDRVSGGDRRLRLWRAARGQATVLAGSGQEAGWRGSQPRPVHPRLARRPAAGWRRLRAGDGAQGPRWYDWRWPPRAPPRVPGWGRWRLVWRVV